MSEAFCPILKDECRSDCAWADVVTTLYDDGITQETFCAVALIAAQGIENEWEDVE